MGHYSRRISAQAYLNLTMWHLISRLNVPWPETRHSSLVPHHFFPRERAENQVGNERDAEAGEPGLVVESHEEGGDVGAVDDFDRGEEAGERGEHGKDQRTEASIAEA